MNAQPPQNPSSILASILRDAAPRLDQEPRATPTVLFNGLRNAGWDEERILSSLHFGGAPALRLRHAQPAGRGGSWAARHVGLITGVRLGPADNALFSWSDTGEVIRWPLVDGGPAFAIHAHSGAVTQCRLLPHSPSATEAKPMLLTAGVDRCARLWNAETGELRAEMTGHEGAVLCLAVSSTGDRALTGSADGTLWLWNLEHGTLMAVLTGHTAAVTACSFVSGATGPDAVEIVSAASDGSLVGWGNRRVVRQFKGHTAGVTSMVVAPVGDALVTTAHDCTVRVWTLSSGVERHVLSGHILGVSGCRVGGSRPPTIVSWSLDRSIRQWNLESGQSIGEPMRHDGAVEGCAPIFPSRLLSWSADATLRLWDQRSGAEVARAEEKSPFQAGDWDDRCAVATARGTLRIWNNDLTPQQTLCSAETRLTVVQPLNRVPGGFWTDTNAILVAGSATEIDIANGEQRQLPLDPGAMVSHLEGPQSSVNLAVSTTRLTGAALAGNGTRMLMWSNAAVFSVDLSFRGPIRRMEPLQNHRGCGRDGGRRARHTLAGGETLGL